MEPQRLHAVVHGDVQGVGFRFFLMRTAQAQGLRGWVRNRSDGSVEFVAEGPRADLEKLLEDARQGPRHAEVTDVQAEWSEATGGLGRFDLIY